MVRSLLCTIAVVCGGWIADAHAATATTSPASQPSSVLAKLAASMKPGTFALLNKDGDESGYGWDNMLRGGESDSGPVGSIFGYSQKAAYDPVTDKVYFRGTPHYQGKGRWGATQICYDIATNRWTKVFPVPAPVGHSYDSNAINPTAREFYASAQLQPYLLRRYRLDSQKWLPMTQPDTVGFGPGEPSAEYFPERDELLWVQGTTLGAYNHSTDKWRRVAPLPGIYFRSAVARYIPRRQCAIIIGGADTNKSPTAFSHAVYKYDRDGKVTQLKDSPASIKVYISRAVVAVDPVSGDCLFIQAILGKDINDFTGKIEFWKFDVAADKWTQLDESTVPRDWWQENYPFAVVATPISKHGVILYMSAAGAKSKVYLYKGVQP